MSHEKSKATTEKIANAIEGTMGPGVKPTLSENSLRYSGSSESLERQREVAGLKKQFPEYNSLRLSAAITFNENNVARAAEMLARERERQLEILGDKDQSDERGSGSVIKMVADGVIHSDDEEETDDTFKSLKSLRRQYLPSSPKYDPRHHFRDVASVQYRCIFNASLVSRFMRKWKHYKEKYGAESKEATPVVAYYEATGLSARDMHSLMKHGPSVPSLFKRLTSGDKMAFGAGIYFIDDPGHIVVRMGQQHIIIVCAILPGLILTEPGDPFDSLHFEEHRVLYSKAQVLPLYLVDVTELND